MEEWRDIPGTATIEKVAREKPLGIKAYGHIAHLPNSRMGPGDHKCHEGQARIATEKARDKHDTVIVEEKLDGSCVSVAKVDGRIVALGRAGYLAISSPYLQHRMFHNWVWTPEVYARFDEVLSDGERIVGEWLAQAHGTRYELKHEPFVAFDLMRKSVRATREEFRARLGERFITPTVLSAGLPFSIENAMAALGKHGHHGAIDQVEGAVWRVERKGAVDFLCKYVRPDKVDGCYLPEITGGEPVWNYKLAIAS